MSAEAFLSVVPQAQPPLDKNNNDHNAHTAIGIDDLSAIVPQQQQLPTTTTRRTIAMAEEAHAALARTATILAEAEAFDKSDDEGRSHGNTLEDSENPDNHVEMERQEMEAQDASSEERPAKESALNEAESASTANRPPNFTPYIHHVHDPSVLKGVLDALTEEPSAEIKATEVYRTMDIRQTENNAAANCHDCLGISQAMLFGGILPSGYGTGVQQDKNAGGNSTLGAMLNATQLLKETSFTSQPTLPINLPYATHVGEETVLYPCGRHLTITHLTDSSSRRLLNTHEKVLGVVAFVVSTDGKYLAVSERYVDHNAISIYRIDSGAKVNTLDYRMLAKTLVTELHFSSNNRYLVTITAYPEHKMFLWLLEEMRVVGICEDLTPTPISKIRFNGWHSASLASISPNRLFHWFHADRDVTAVDVLEHHEQRRRQLIDQQQHPEKYGHKKDDSKPSRLAPSSVSKIILFDGEEDRLAHPRFVAVQWYEDKSYAALTEDGWLIVVEEDFKIKMCTQIRLPDRKESVAEPSHQQLLNHTVANAAQQGGSATPNHASHRASVADSTTGGLDPSSPCAFSGISGQLIGDANASALSMLRAITSPHRPSTTSTGGHGAPVGKKGDVQSVESPSNHFLTTIFSGIAWCSRGLLVTGPRGWITLLDRTYSDTTPFIQMANISVCSLKTPVLSLSVSPGETNIVLAFGSNSLAHIMMNKIDDAIDLARAEKRKAAEGNSGAGIAPSSSSAAADPRNATPPQISLISPLSSSDALDASSSSPVTASAAASLPQTARAAPPPPSAPSTVYTPRGGLTLPSRGGVVGGFEDGEGDADQDAVTLDGSALLQPMPHTQFHRSIVTCISTAVQRPFMATSSVDGEVVVYDYLRRRVVCTHRFGDTVLSCALHPTGAQLIVCESFTTGLYAVLDSGLLLLTVVGVRGAQFARFSGNGGRIAFAVSNRVFLFNSATLENMGMLNGHASNIRNVRWYDNDARLATCDVSGAVMGWNAYTCKRVGIENTHRNLVLSAVCGLATENTFAAVGSTRQARGAVAENEFTIVGTGPASRKDLVYLRPGFIYPRSSVNRKFHTSLLCFSDVSKTLFVGTPAGRVLLYSWPLTRVSKPYHIIDAHEGEILHMHLSHDEQFLFSIGDDNLCFVYQLQHMREGRFMAIPTFDYSITDPIKLVGADVQQRNVGAEMEVLQELIKFKGEDIQASARQLKRAHEKACMLLAKAAQQKLSALKAEVASVREECKTLVEKGKAERKQADAQFQITSEAIENQYGKVAEAYALKMNALRGATDGLIVSFEAANATTLKKAEETRLSMEAQRVEREKQLANDLHRLQQEIKARARDADAMIDQTIIDGERELHQLQTEQAAVMKETLEAIQRVSHVQSFGEREAERLRKEIHNHKEELKAKAIIQADLERQTAHNAQRNLAHRNNNKLRQEEINIAEKNLQQLRQQLSSLENLRFVLIHQFEQLQSEIEPKEDTIRQLERAIIEREGLLGHVHRERNELKEQLQNTTQRLEKAGALYKKTMLGKHIKHYGVASLAAELAKIVDEFGGDHEKATALFKGVLDANLHKGAPGIVPLPAVKGSDKASSALSKAEAKPSTSFSTPNATVHKSKEDIEAERFANEELRRQSHYLSCQHESLVRSIGEKGAIASVTKQAFREENERYLKDIRQLQIERKAQTEALKSLEVQLRETRAELHSVIDSIEAKKRQTASEVKHQPPNEADSQLLPPVNTNLRRSSTPQRHSSSASSVPSPSSVKVLGSVSKRQHFGGGLPPLRVIKSSDDAVRPSLFKSQKGFVSVKKSSVSHHTTANNDNDGEDDDDDGTDANTEKDISKPSRVIQKARRTAKERLAQREQLQSLIDQLDANTSTMRTQQVEANRLRAYVKELLAKEEQTVVRQVGTHLTGELNVTHFNANRSTVKDPSSSSMLLRIDTNAHTQPSKQQRKLADSSSPASLPSVAVVPTIADKDAASTAEADDLIYDDTGDDDGQAEDVDWVGQQARPMTPVAGPQ